MHLHIAVQRALASPDMATLRPYRIEDQEAVVAIWWESWHSIRPGLRHPEALPVWRTRWTTEIVPAQTIVVAEAEGVVVGFAAADTAARALTQIFVTPRYKRRGLGRRLFAWAQQLMPEGFTLHTLTENFSSRAFYERHGLVPGDSRINPVNGMETIGYRWTPLAQARPNFTAPR
jgi:GNAT superfamily N-acetyltransferase